MVILPDDHTGYHFRTKDEKSGRVDGWKRSAMKLFRWIAPPILAIIELVSSMIIVALSYEPEIGYGAFYILGIWTLFLPVLSFVYARMLLKECKHRVCYTLYCSFCMGFVFCITSIMRGPGLDSVGLLISFGLSLWCEVGALAGLLRKSSPE